MSRYHLFYSPGACSLAPHILLEEIGAEYEATRVTIAEGKNRSPEYLAVNPRARVPALIVPGALEGNVLTEATAIMIFLARRHPELALLPADVDAFARACEWMSWLASNMHQAGVRTVLRPERFLAEGGDPEPVRRKGRETVRAGMDDIESRLRDRPWALGETYSAVDAYLLVFFRWGNRIGLPMRLAYPRYTRVMDAVRARPAVVRAIEQEGIEIE